MLSRCYNPKATGYQWYGGRGILVQESWRTFINFYNDMGTRPEGKSLDRIDSNKDYTKDNCRWSTSKEQANNISSNVMLEYEGMIFPVSTWARMVGLLPNTLQYRLYRGWSVKQALGFSPRVVVRKRRLSEEEEQYVFDSYKAGEKTQTQLGKEFNLDSSQISRTIKKYNETKEERHGNKQSNQE